VEFGKYMPPFSRTLALVSAMFTPGEVALSPEARPLQ
jgi:hypothetical protein